MRGIYNVVCPLSIKHDSIVSEGYSQYLQMNTLRNATLGCEQPSSSDAKQLPNAQDAFWPLPGLTSCAGMTGSVGMPYTCNTDICTVQSECI